ncbi:MAG: hypothetical protein AB7E16_03695 [Candidatus Izemoplasmatales bacterium]
MTNKIKLLLLYLLSAFVSAVSCFFYYKYIFGADYPVNFIFVAIFIVPIILLISSILFDRLVLKETFKQYEFTLSIIYLPLLISIHFIVITFVNMSGFSEAIFLWYFLLFLPVLLTILFFHIVYIYALKYKRALIITKYILSVILYFYCFFIYLVYGLSGLGV